MSTLTATQLQQQYIAYFGRPGDPAGIKYWLSSSSGISSAREFADKIYAQDEYKKSTVGTKSTEAQVNSLYQNLFGREADAGGLIYWTGEIEAGRLTLSNIAYDLIAAASNPVSGNETQGAADALALSNKVSAATAFTADVEASTSAILAYQPESSSPWVTGAAFESAATYLTGITTTAHTDTGVDSAVSSMITANTSAGSTTAGTTNKFTSTTDSLAGGAGNDTFNGVLQLTDAAAVTGTTIAPGDDVEGKGGTDTVAISVAGTQNTGYTLNAVVTTDVEKVLLSNFETSTSDTTIDGSLMTGLTTVGLSSSSSTGDSVFTGVKNLVDAEMRNGAADLTVTYVDTVLAGETDTQNLSLSNITAGTFTANGAETIVITSEISKNTLTGFSATDNKTLTINGDKSLTITNALTTKTIDASASTGGVNLNIGTQATSIVTGGSGDDTIQFKTAQITKDDIIKGGAGTDTLKLAIGNATYDGESDTSGQELYGVSGFETVDIDATHDNAEIELDTLSGNSITTLKAGANTLIVTPAGDASNDTTKTIAFTLNGTAYTSASVDLAGDATTDLPLLTAALATKINSISGFEATDNSTTVTVTNTGTEEVQISFTDVASEQSYTVGTTYNVSFADASADQALDIYSGAIVKHRFKDASGSTDVLNVNFKSVSGDKALDTTVEDLNIANTETLNINTSGKGTTSKYTLSDLSGDASLKTLNVTGSNDLVISATATGNTKLATVDASAFTGDLTISTMTASLAQTVTTGSGNDNVDFGANLTELDVIDLGGNASTTGGWQATTGKTGKDKLEATGNLGTATDDSVLQISNVEVFEINMATTAATYIDASKMSNVGQISLAATGSGTTKIKSLAAGTNIGLGVGADEYAGTLDVALADATGTADSLGLVLSDTVDGSDVTTTLKTTGIETINITATKDATNAGQTYTVGMTDVDASKVVITGGNTTYPDTYALGTLNANITTVDASDLDGLLTITAIASGVATTVSHKGTQIVTANLSSGNDTVTLGKIGTVVHDIDVSTGVDTLNATLNNAASDFSTVDGVETFNLTIADEASTGFNHATKINGLNEATTVNITGGNSLSSFTIATGDIHDDSIGTSDNIQTIDASAFGGNVDILLDPTAFDDSLTIKGPTASTTDIVRFDAQEADGKIKSMTGIETLALFTSDNDLDGVVDLANATGVTKITLAYTTATNDDAVEFKNIETGTLFQLTSTQELDAITIGMADASSTTTAVDIELMDFTDSANDTIDINATGVETITINDKSDDTGTEAVDLAGVTATSGSKTKLVLKGGNLTLKSLSTSFNEIDASSATGGITLSGANRPATAITITGGLGDDNFAMENSADAIDGGLGTDTLTLVGNAVIGGYAVDLTAADQVSQYAGISNAAIQTGFENVTASGVTGSKGLDLTGTTKANVVVGTSYADNITPGLGADDVTGGAGADFIDFTESTASADTYRLVAFGTNGLDKITGFDVSNDKIFVVKTDLHEDEDGAGTAITYDEGSSAGDTVATDAGIYVDNTNNLSALTMAGIVISGGDIVTASGDQILYVAGDGTDTHIFHVAIANTTLHATNDTATHIATIVGLADAGTLSKANFVHTAGSDTAFS